MGERREPVALTRDCEATQIPSGFRVTLPKGSFVSVQQVLGGNFTCMTELGALVRIADPDADALGPAYAAEAEKALARPAPQGGAAEYDDALVWEQLATVYDPEIPASIVDLGLVYLVASEPLPAGGHKVVVRMTLTAPGCGVGPMIVEDVRRKVAAVPGVKEADVDLVFEPPWDPSMMTEAARLQLGML